MTKLKDAAQAFEPQRTLNISELNKIPLDIEVEEKTFQDKDGKDFTIMVTEVDGKEYRVPKSVLMGIKAIMQKMPNVKFVSVLKTGQALNTTYTVVPFTE